ncbi:MAG TPA: hypothetical protein VEU30_08420 [Thermoanaerobaculia bacterium]|nr:hypothetical protein [Thermoanaerobaculia bacterium]
MRKTFTAAVALTVAIAIAAPVVAAPRHRNEPPTVVMLVTKMVKRICGIGAAAEPTVPIPGSATPSTSTTTTVEEPVDPKGKK